jgi:AcrR family transcriptional regulator
VRRDPDEAKRLILEAAAQLLREGGPASVQVRAVAARLGITDAAINHHFGTRDQLLEALLRDAGRRIRRRVREIIEAWSDEADMAALVDGLASAYAEGYGELGIALNRSGWRDRTSGMLAGVVDELQKRAEANCRAEVRTPPSRQDVELTIAALHQALATESAFGHEFRRSVGYRGTAHAGAAAARAWWTDVLRRLVEGK